MKQLLLITIILTSSLSFGLTAEQARKQTADALAVVLQQDYKQCKADLELEIKKSIKLGQYSATNRDCRQESVYQLTGEYQSLGFEVYTSNIDSPITIIVEWKK